MGTGKMFVTGVARVTMDRVVVRLVFVEDFEGLCTPRDVTRDGFDGASTEKK